MPKRCGSKALAKHIKEVYCSHSPAIIALEEEVRSMGLLTRDSFAPTYKYKYS
jgi:hypothetical protein